MKTNVRSSVDIKRNRTKFINSFKKLKKKYHISTTKIARNSKITGASITADYIYHLTSTTHTSNRPLTTSALRALVVNMNLAQKDISWWIKYFTPKDKNQEILVQNMSQLDKYVDRTRDANTEKQSAFNDLIVKRVKVLMKSKNWSAKKLAQKSRLNETRVNHFLKGKVNLFTMPDKQRKREIAQLAIGLGTSTKSLTEKPKKSAVKSSNRSTARKTANNQSTQASKSGRTSAKHSHAIKPTHRNVSAGNSSHVMNGKFHQIDFSRTENNSKRIANRASAQMSNTEQPKVDPDVLALAEKLQKVNITDRGILRLLIDRTINWQRHIKEQDSQMDELKEQNQELQQKLTNLLVHKN